MTSDEVNVKRHNIPDLIVLNIGRVVLKLVASANVGIAIVIGIGLCHCVLDGACKV
jgi:hypothetical protein